MNLPPPGDAADDFRPERKSNTTLIVVLVVGACMLFCCVPAGLVGLLFPAIGRVREAASRTRSQNNVKQMIFAIHNYHDANQSVFPYACDFGPGTPTGAGLVSLHFQILPYAEGGNVFQMYQSKVPTTYYAPPNGAAGYVFRTYISPADNSVPDGYQASGVNIAGPGTGVADGTYAPTSYAVNGMVFSHQPDGKPPSIKAITDGTSTTIVIAERFQLCRSATDSVPTLWGMGAYSATTPTFALAPPKGKYPQTTNFGWQLQQFVPPAKVVPGTALSAPFQLAPQAGSCDPRIMQTPHPGGLIVALADGSTRVVASNITPATFWALVTPAGGESVGNDW